MLPPCSACKKPLERITKCGEEAFLSGTNIAYKLVSKMQSPSEQIADQMLPIEHVQKQSDWYGRQAGKNRMWYRSLKTAQIILAAAIPIVALATNSHVQPLLTAILGGCVGVLEGILQLGQYQQNWIAYRSTREALKREKFLHGAKAGPYSNVLNCDVLYVERTDTIMSAENAKWLTSSQPQGSVGVSKAS